MATRISSAVPRARGMMLAAVSRPAAVGLQQRWLSLSASRQTSHVITFSKSVSPEIKDELQKIRDEIILPTYLAPEQQKMIYNPKYEKKLQKNPITMEIDGEVVNFGYRDRMAMPNTQVLMRHVAKGMKTPADFNNLSALLEGVVKQAHRKLHKDVLEKFVVQAQYSGCMKVIMDCVTNAKKTGFKPNTPRLIDTLVTAIQRDAIDSGFSMKKTEQARRRIQTVLEILEVNELEKVRRNTKTTGPTIVLHRDPTTLAARLHMAAAMAAKHYDGKDLDGSVTKYAEELVQLWPEGKGLGNLYPAEYYKRNELMRHLAFRPRFFGVAAAIANGFLLAAEVVTAPELASQLRTRGATVKAEAEALLATAAGDNSRSTELFNKLFGEQKEAVKA
ncbi:hypothetical protein B0T17DRAFT_533073 [Bombardia bombarda]|uniref:Uncharacterized protein n=1 Tax=Bombardia bombarda TaxID=252184 RepID=A0AA40C1L2_9PEZI|nr:hypothetical protein B0T17DRAFT_533073 [Bombardia bombarda]